MLVGDKMTVNLLSNHIHKSRACRDAVHEMTSPSSLGQTPFTYHPNFLKPAAFRFFLCSALKDKCFEMGGSQLWLS